MSTIERLTNAAVPASATTLQLQQSLKHANSVQALVILPLIERAAILQRDIENLCAAIKADEVKS